jgi:hypothetical protein
MPSKTEPPGELISRLMTGALIALKSRWKSAAGDPPIADLVEDAHGDGIFGGGVGDREPGTGHRGVL